MSLIAQFRENKFHDSIIMNEEKSEIKMYSTTAFSLVDIRIDAQQCQSSDRNSLGYLLTKLTLNLDSNRRKRHSNNELILDRTIL